MEALLHAVGIRAYLRRLRFIVGDDVRRLPGQG
jgi:hypothetical protein